MGSVFVPAATNLFPRGQCDATGGRWAAAGVGVTLSVDSTLASPVSTASIKAVCDGLSGGQGIQAITNTGLNAAVGTFCVGSIFFFGVATKAYVARMVWTNTDASQTAGTSLVVTGSGAWAYLVMPAVAVAVGKTGNRIDIQVFESGPARAETIWAAGAMSMQGSSQIAPYVPTSGGNTARRGEILVIQ